MSFHFAEWPVIMKTMGWTGCDGAEIRSAQFLNRKSNKAGVMNKRTVILIAICCLLAVATVTMRYIEQEIAIIRAKFVGEKRTEERSPRGIGSTRPAPGRTPQNDKSLAAVKQNAVRPSGPGVVGQFQPAAAAKAPAARTVITTTAVVPGKNVPVADAVRETGRAVPVEEVTTPLESEPAAVAQAEAPVSERAETAGMPDAAAPSADEKKAPATEAPQGADSAATSAVERPDAPADEAAAGDRGGMRDAADEGESDESQGEETIDEEEPATVEEDEEGEQVAADEEPFPGAEEPSAEPTEEVVDEE
jgi:hypothetical protein